MVRRHTMKDRWTTALEMSPRTRSRSVQPSLRSIWTPGIQSKPTGILQNIVQIVAFLSTILPCICAQWHDRKRYYTPVCNLSFRPSHAPQGKDINETPLMLRNSSLKAKIFQKWMNRWFDLVSIRIAAMAPSKFHTEKFKEAKYFLMQVLDLSCQHTYELVAASGSRYRQGSYWQPPVYYSSLKNR